MRYLQKTLLILTFLAFGCKAPSIEPTPELILEPGEREYIIPPPSDAPTVEAPILTLEGEIIDKITGENIRATVTILWDTGGSFTIGPLCSFSLPIPADGATFVLRVEAEGYKVWEIEITPHIKRHRILYLPVKMERK
jgi:hypothetical protein